MKFFRPDRDQVSMFTFKGIDECQICLDKCGTSRIVAQPGCCKRLVHLDCFNTLAAHPNSALTFTCPKCDRELSGESVRAARRRTSLGTGKESEEEEGSEIILVSRATQNITSTKTTHCRPISRSDGDVHRQQKPSESLSESLESTDALENANPPTEAAADEVSDPPRRLGRDSQTLTFFTPYQELERKLAAEQKDSQPKDFFSWLLVMIAGRKQRQDVFSDDSNRSPSFI
jgi:hypothetical protein